MIKSEGYLTMTKQLNVKVQKNILLIVVVMFWFSQYVYMPYQTPYLISIGVTASFVGVVVGAYGLSQMLLRMPVGIIADLRGHHRFFIIIGAASSGLASLFRIFIPDGIGFLLGSLFSGLASAMWISFMVLYSNYFKKEEMQKSMGTIIAANNIGILIGFVCGSLFYDKLGMNFLCILSLIAALPSTILGFFIKEPTVNFTPLSVKQLVTVYKDKRLIGFSLLALIQQGVLMSTAMSFTNQVARQLGASGLQIGISSIIYISAAVISSYFSASKLALKQGPGIWIPGVLICICIYCLIIPNVHFVIYIYFAQILIAMSTGILFSFCTSEAMKNVKQDRKSTAMGYFQAIYALGMTIFPVFTGIIANNYSISTSYYFMSFISAVGFLGAVYFYKFKISI
ncbi:MAG: MFS transporter [Clostridium sp.]|uniref:MFS transporter n=1 Tax=Clostridium sp. TaxID=1506 RepID=UPI0025C5F633|nr:MFS transporter [Clostridium sp.]MCH3964809.1 MFS transporter [Clostridium sp.]MCI1715280.1 MFS transporter [Clostridium sp.]MCI1799542.1 MFS transporter [Clostridium sp.]MCI1813463.1 MFS transporter [Clostridium sp.]MCI1870354.1 MFS transporter [Clostridium sp.]